MPLIRLEGVRAPVESMDIAEPAVDPAAGLSCPYFPEEVFISPCLELLLRQLLRGGSGSLPSCFSGLTNSQVDMSSLYLSV